MEIKVDIIEDVITSNTSVSTNDDNITLKGAPLKITHKPMYFGFSEKIYSILKNPNHIELKKTTTASNQITWVTVYSNSDTSDIFSLFKSMGMFMPKLTVGVDDNTNHVFVSSKMCRDLNRFSDTQRAAVVMYLLSLVQFVIKASHLINEYEHNAFDGTLKISCDLSKFIECLKVFENEETWYVSDSFNDSFTSVEFYNTAVSHTNDIFANHDCLKLGLIKEASKQYMGVVQAALGALKYNFIISEKAALTDFELCSIEIAQDSICAAIANAYPKTFALTKCNTLPIGMGWEFVELNEDFIDSEEFNEVSKTLRTWLLNMVAKGAKMVDVSEFSELYKKYSIKVPDSTLDETVGYEEMKKNYETDTYAQELYKQIKPYYSSFKLDENLNANLKGFGNGALYSMVFVGASGTGKSTAARVIPARCGIPYVSINFSVNIEEADLFGSMIPNPKKTSSEDPEFIWTDGIITKAVRNGYCVILEELNFARPGVLGKLNSLLDENRQVDLSTGEIVQAHSNFRIIATCNIAYEGTNRFNKALINRFDDVTVFKDLDRSEAIAVIKERTKYKNASKIAKIYDVYEALKKFATEQNVNVIVSMRQLLNIFTKGKYYSSARDAVQRIILNGAFIEDPEYQKVFEETVLEAFDLKFKI